VVIPTASTQVEDRGNVLMADAGRCARLAQKTKAHRLVVKIASANDLQGNGAAQIDVERFVSDTHRSATQLDRCPVRALRQLIILKALRYLFRRGLDRMLRRRLAGFNPLSESLAKHADRTEFHCSRKLITATRAGASVLRFHGPNRPSDATRVSQRA